jgi:hypothetical protein
VDEAGVDSHSKRKEYIEKILRYVTNQGGQVPLEELEQVLPPPSSWSLQQLLEERRDLFQVKSDPETEKLYVMLANDDDSEPEGIDWDDNSEAGLNEEEEERLLAKLPPSDTELYEFIGSVLSAEKVAPDYYRVEKHF